MIAGLHGRHCVVVGSAPLEAPLTVQASDVVVAVNGGIVSTLVCDVWVLNARGPSDAATAGWRTGTHATMLRQGERRRVEILLLLEKGEGARAHTLKRLAKQATTWARVVGIHNEDRRALETTAGGRDTSMQREALSAGLFAACWCFLQGAETVRLAGVRWAPGYAYPVNVPITTRGHEAGDRQAIALLEQRYPGRLIHALGGIMSKMPRAAADQRPAAELAKEEAKAAILPSAERKRKVEQRQAAKAVPLSAQRLVRATELTFYAGLRRRAGTVFALRQETDFRPSCMEWAEDGATLTTRPIVETRQARLQPNGADFEEEIPAPGRPAGDNPLGV